MYKISVQDIKNKLSNIYDMQYREINWGENTVYVIYAKTMCDINLISRHVISPITNNKEEPPTLEYIKENVITASTNGYVTSLEDAIEHILSGDVVIIFSNFEEGIFCEVKGFVKRAIDIPQSEATIKGPREGFSENIHDNVGIIRKRIKNPDLKYEHMCIGTKSNTSIVMVYVENSAPQKLVNYVRTKIQSVQSEYVVYENSIEEKLRCKRTPFDTIGYSEKPDNVVMKLGEGRVVILVDGSPFALIAPHFFNESFQTTDDYDSNKFVANIGRVLRWLSFTSSVLLPGLYVALFTYHFKLIPYMFVFKMARSRAGVPFPLALEAIIMILFFQILREAGIRLPQPIGPALSIVGALILGDAAVNSGLASQVTVLVTALTSIATFLTPTLYIATFVWNVLFILFSALLGLPGFFTCFVLFSAHLSGLTSCGYPYLYPLGTLNVFKYKDITFRGDLDRINQNIFTKDEDK